MALSDQLVQRIASLAQAKLEQIEEKLREVCQHDELNFSLREFEEFFGVRLEPRLVPVEEAVRSPSTSKMERPQAVRQPSSGAYTALCQALPPVLQKIGARNKKFTSVDVVAAVKDAGISDFKPEWVSLILSSNKMAGVAKVGTTKREGKRSLNQYQFIQPVQSSAETVPKKKRRRRRRRKTTEE